MLSLFITHLQGYKRQAVRSPVFITLEVICELILPLIMAEIVDVAIPAGDTAYIFRLGAVMLALSLLSMAFGVLSAKYATFASQGFGANLRQCLFDKVQEFSFADIDRFSSASLITRMTNDVNAMTMMLNMGLRMLVRAPVMLIAALGISISINPRLAVVLLVVIPLMILAIGILMKICTKLFEVMQTKIDGLNNTLQENLVAIRVVKAFVREDHERKKIPALQRRADDGRAERGHEGHCHYAHYDAGDERGHCGRAVSGRKNGHGRGLLAGRPPGVHQLYFPDPDERDDGGYGPASAHPRPGLRPPDQ